MGIISVRTKFSWILKCERNDGYRRFMRAVDMALFSVHVCTLKAQDDLRYEDNIDAYSMSGNQGRATPALRMLTTGGDDGTFLFYQALSFLLTPRSMFSFNRR